MENFGYTRFERATSDGLAAFCKDLAEHLAEQLRGRDFLKATRGLVADLKLAGHDLSSLDQGDDFQIWGPNYIEPKPGVGLVVTFEKPDKVTVEVNQSET